MFAESAGSDVKQPGAKGGAYAAKVGDRIITIEQYNDAVSKLHSGNRVGEALSSSSSFSKPDYKGFLDELIERELVMGEAEKLGLHKNAKFVEKVELNRLNIFLGILKDEEVIKKVSVSQTDVALYYKEVESKEIEKALKEKKAADSSVDDSVRPFEELTLDEKKNLSTKLYLKRLGEIEASFLKRVRKDASVKIYKKAFEAFSVDDVGTWDVTVAKAEGMDITGRDLAVEMRMSRATDAMKEAVLDRLIRNKALDALAASKGYDKRPDVVKRLEKFYGDALIDEFKRTVIVPLVQVSDEDIKGYYEKNKEKFRAADLLNLRGIIVTSEADAKGVIKELKNGASFSFLAERLSVDKMSAKKGGDMGWIAANMLSEDVLKDVLKAKRGKILGPYRAGNHMYVVYEFRELKAGTYAAPDSQSVRDEIQLTLSKQRFKDNYDSYLKRLYEVVPITVNDTIFKGVQNAGEAK